MLNKFDDVKEDSQILKEDLRDAVREVRDEAGEYVGEMGRHASKAWHDTRAKAQVKGREVDALAREHTWAFAAVSLVVGVLLGAVIGRDHRR